MLLQHTIHPCMTSWLQFESNTNMQRMQAKAAHQHQP
jgi:hypothetical protein